MLAYARIDEVEAAPKFGSSGPAGWGFACWSDRLGDEAPHRDLLARIAAEQPEVALTLPDLDRYEDYVEARLTWASHEVWVYYETILSHVRFWSHERDPVETLRAVVLATAVSI